MALPNVSPIVKVYHGKPILPEVSRVLACLYEKDFEMIAFQNVVGLPVDLIRLQASTSVPAPFFEDGSKFLFESRAISRYISETYADRGNRYLLGRDLLDRVSIEQWLKSEEQSFDPPSRALVLHLAFPLSNKTYNDLLEESERLAKVLDVYNHRLGESRFLAGEEFTLADLTHLPNSQYIATSSEWGHLIDERKNVKRWWEEVSTRSSWSKVVEDIEISQEEEEEITEDLEENAIAITRPPQMHLKASIFQPIEATVELPESTTTIYKIAPSPRRSVQVTIPAKRGFLASVPEKKGAQVETTQIQSHSTPHTKQPVADAKVTMEEFNMPPTGTQISPTVHIDKVSTGLTRVESQSTKPPIDAKVTIEGCTVPPTVTQIPSATRTDKASTEPTRGVPQSTKPVTDASVTREKTFSPPTSKEVPPTHETTPKSAKVTKENAASPTDETSTRKSSGLSFRQEPTPTSKTVQPMKPSLEGTQATPTEKTTTKPLTKDQGQTISPPASTDAPPMHEITTKSANVTRKYTASPTDETSMNKSRGLPSTQTPLPNGKTRQPTKPSLEGTETPPTEKTTTKPLTKDQDQSSATEPKRVKASEEPTNKEDKKEMKEEAYLAAKHKEWGEQWREPEKFGEKHIDSIRVQKPEPPKIEDTTPSTTPTPTTTSSETARQEPVTSKSTNAPVKEPSESRTTTKPKDTPPTAIQDPSLSKTNKVPDQLPKQPKHEGMTVSTTQTPAVETTSQTVTAEPTSGKSMRGPTKEPSQYNVPVPQEESSRGRINTKPQERAPAADTTQTTTVPAATQTPAAETTPQTVTAEPTADKSRREPAKEPSKSNAPFPENESSRGRTNTKPQDRAPAADATQTTTVPAATQSPPPPSTNGTTGEIANKTNNVPAKTRTATFPTATPESRTDKPDTVPATETAKPTVPATENISRGSSTKEPKERTPLATEVETTGEGQTLKATTQTPPADEATAGTTDVSQSKKAPAELEEASTGTKLGNDLARKSQADTQKTTSVDVATSKPRVTDTEKPQPVDETGTEKTKDKAPSIQTPKDILTKGMTSAQTTSSEKVTNQGTSLEEATKDQASERTVIEAKTPSSDNQRGSELSQETKTEPNELDSNKPNQTTLQPAADATQTPTVPAATQSPPPPSTNGTTGEIANKTNNVPAKTPTATFPTATPESRTNKPDTVLSTETAKPTVPATEDMSRGSSTKEPKERTPLATEAETTGEGQTPPATTQTPPPDEATAGTTDVSQSKKATAELEEASTGTKLGNDLAPPDEASKGTTSEAKTPSSDTDNQKGGELSQDEKSSSKDTAPTSDGSSTAPDTTPKQQETQNETKMETKTEPAQLGINKPNQIISQPNKTNDANPRNETLSETNQNKAAPQDKETTSLDESLPKPRNEQNPEPANNE